MRLFTTDQELLILYNGYLQLLEINRLLFCT